MKILWLLLFVSFTAFHGFGQEPATGPVSGTVVDEYGHPMEGVQIEVEGRAAATVLSDDAGEFEISAATGESLVFTYKNYLPQKRLASGDPTEVRMARSYLQSPEEVDVLYDSRSKDRILGAVSSIYTGQLTSTPAPLYAHALAGRLPGLYTQQSRGWTSVNSASLVNDQGVFGTIAALGTQGLQGPNDNTEIGLRLRGQAPITIIDGVQREIYTIDPENIESVTVLKDALSTVLLGQRSSRGVVLVTTKKLQAGTPRVSFTAQSGMQSPLGLPEPLPSYKYAYLYNEALANQGSPLAYTYQDFQTFRDQSSPFTHPDVNWFTTILKPTAPLSRYSLNMTGGGGAARYSVGLGYLGQDGLFNADNDDYNTNAQIRRYTINTNIDVNVTKEFTAKLQIYARIQDGNQPGSTTDGLISTIYNTPNNAYPVYNPDGSFGGTQQFPNNLYAALNRSGYIEDYTRDILTNLDLNYRFDKWVEGLWAKVQSNISVYGSNITNRRAGVPSFKLAVTPTGDTAYSRYGSLTDQINTFTLTYSAQYWYLQNAIGYGRQFGKHNVNAKLHYDRNQVILNYDLPEVNQNIAANASYDYDGKYFVEGTVNYSGNDRYPPGKQFGLFYAGGLGWNIAGESFIKDNSSLNWINQIKLRATYGRTGNVNVGYFTWREAYTGQSELHFYGPDRALQFGIEQSTLANPYATWEKADKLNVGVDIALFNNQLQFSADYYRDKYFDLMMQRGKQTQLIGIAYPRENIGESQYQGVELSATHQKTIGAISYFVTANASFEKSKVLYMDEVRRSYDWNRRTGQPVGMPFGYLSDGLILTQAEAETAPSIAGYVLRPGDIKYRDLNGDGTINQYDEAPIGTTKPLIYYGLSAGLSFKGFDLNILLQGVENRLMYLPANLLYAFGSNGMSQAYNRIEGRWTPETGKSSTYPTLTPGVNPNNDANVFGGNNSDFWAQNGDYFRIKNLEIGYTFPYSVTNKWKIPAVRVFANGLNLLTVSHIGDFDPEVYSQVYPIQRVLNFGINVKF